MSPRIRCCPPGPLWLLLAALLFLWGAPARAVATQSAVTARLDACGAMAAEPGLGEIAGGGPSRLDATLRPGDSGFGCRFTLEGDPRGSLETVEVRLSRPGAVAGSVARDRWFVPVRRGSAAVAAYAFADPGEIREGEWTLELYLGEALLAQKRFEVAADTASPLAMPVAAHEEADPQPEASTSGGAGPVAVTEPAHQAESDTPPLPSVPPPPASLPAPTPPAATSPVAAPPERKPVRASAAGPLPHRQAAPEPAGASGETKASAGPFAARSPGATRFYALQTGLFADAGNAEGQAARLRARGLPACLSVEGEGGRRRYRVLSGRFGDRRAAQVSRAEVTAVAGASPLLFPVDPDLAARLRCH